MNKELQEAEIALTNSIRALDLTAKSLKVLAQELILCQTKVGKLRPNLTVIEGDKE